MGNEMSKKSRLEFATQIQSRYLRANNAAKEKILYEFVENYGYHFYNMRCFLMNIFDNFALFYKYFTTHHGFVS